MNCCHDCGGPGTAETPLALYQFTLQEMPCSDPAHLAGFYQVRLCAKCLANLVDSLHAEENP